MKSPSGLRSPPFLFHSRVTPVVTLIFHNLILRYQFLLKSLILLVPVAGVEPATY